MTMKAQSADGVIHEFPDDTAPEVIDRAMKSYAASLPKPEGRLERIGHGLMDPILGAAQLGARLEDPGAEMGAALVPGGIERYQQEKTERAATIDKTIREREAAIQARRPTSEQGTTDWLRLAGGIPTTIALAPAGPSIPAAVVGGALGGAIQPETDTENFATQKAVGAGLGAAGGALGAGLIKAGGAIYSAIRNPESNAIAQLARAAQRDGDTIEAIQQRLRETRRFRPDATFADVSGENVRGLVERIGQTPGAGVAKLAPRMTQRQQEQLGRISTDLASLTGTSRTAFEATEQTMAARAAAAEPLYQQAYEEGEKAIWSPGLERLSSAPAVRSAMQSAITTWQNNAVADGFGAMNPTMIDRGGLITFGKSIPAFPNLQFWDYTKRVLDNEIAAAVRAGEDGKVRTFTRLVNMLRAELDNPEQGLPTYRAARAAWGGPSQYLDAIEAGRTILARNVSSEEMAAQFGELSEAAKEGYRIGATSAIRASMGNDPAKLGDMTKYLRSPEMRAKLSAMMPTPEAAERWLQSLDYEVRASELTGQVLKGSPTARRLAQQADADSIGADLVLSAINPLESHGAMAFVKAVLRGLKGKSLDTLRSRSDNILIDILTTPEGATTVPSSISQAREGYRISSTPLTSPAAELAAGPLAAGAGGALAPGP